MRFLLKMFSLCSFFSIFYRKSRCPSQYIIDLYHVEELLCYQEAVDLLKRTGKSVSLKIYRYPKGLKFQQVEVCTLYLLYAPCPQSND